MRPYDEMKMDSMRQQAYADPMALFQGVVAVIAPHMDDEVLACGGTIARLPYKERVHCIYATDGSQSPIPLAPWLGSAAPDLSAVRTREARAALDVLGVPSHNLHFLGFPDGRLRHHMQKFGEALDEVLHTINPQHLLVPFRYDRHPDHLAVNRVTTSIVRRGYCKAELFEYFVYANWQLLPKRDIRRYISPEHMLEVDIADETLQKRRALECFKSQTTRFYSWQHRANLTAAFLEEICRRPEVFLRYSASFPNAAIFIRATAWIHLVHAVEPPLKRSKDRLAVLLQSLKRDHDGHPPA